MIKKETKQERLRKILKVLEFLTTIDDIEVIKSSIEGAIELLKEEVKQPK